MLNSSLSIAHRHHPRNRDLEWRIYELRAELNRIVFALNAGELPLPEAFRRHHASGYCAKEMLPALDGYPSPQELIDTLEALDKAEHPWEHQS